MRTGSAETLDIGWDDFRFVLAVARRGTLAAAATALQVNESTVSRRIARAEARLQARLFDRVDGRLVPTDAGRRLVGHAERIEGEIQAAGTTVLGADRDAAGVVRVTSVPLIVNRVLVPALPGFLDSYPALQVHLVADPTDLSLMQRDVDIALRLARPRREAQALTRRLGTIAYGVFAHAAAAPDVGWIGYTDAMRFLPQAEWLAEQVGGEPTELVRARVNDAEAVFAAVKAGLGRAFLPLFLADREPDLRRVDDGSRRWDRELWIMIHPGLRHLIRVEITADWLAGAVGACLAPECR